MHELRVRKEPGQYSRLNQNLNIPHRNLALLEPSIRSVVIPLPNMSCPMVTVYLHISQSIPPPLLHTARLIHGPTQATLLIQPRKILTLDLLSIRTRRAPVQIPGLPLHLIRNVRANTAQMLHEPHLSMLVCCMSGLDLLQAVAHQELVVARGRDCSRDVDQDRDPRVAIVDREDAATKEGGTGQSCAEIPGQIGGDCVGRETPDHRCVGDADGEWDTGRGNEWVGRVQTGPDDNADVEVDEEFLEEQETLRSSR